ncbi:CoxG family protein [Pusillimonas noertemannii]|uniref:Carbon monoxide dehydrogenase subunit G n=1 Tax=Pusillimonas noertemannii TaxID=305977 RepID=A0A2U1CLS5_9BURK|nr:SRPBCC family protein [Pusillimonas noertemannii]NYT69010.1 SRPBCC family protein [Pusillimonas noertemannii]PVY61970.1 carbon monoxide dehydrogenase subunit G [Pusillimonas noertemannii]TFL11022.1 4-hydroxybenzoyl-CoA reductase [Pusillimonas noertemannii]
MEIEKTLTVSAPRERVWALLLDPHVMTGAVPGMQSIDVISPTEYVALMKVKISFLSAKFKLHTTIAEQREPEYLRAEGTGEDASVASSLKQTSEIFLSETPQGGTELRIKVNVDLLGRLGTFGLSVMKTKADRMWDEFGRNLAARLENGETTQIGGSGGVEAAGTSSTKIGAESQVPPSSAPDAAAEKCGPRSLQREAAPQPASPSSTFSPARDTATSDDTDARGWFSRLLGGGRTTVNRAPGRSGGVIRIEVRQLNRTVAIEWPVEAAGQCQDWLRELLSSPV